MNRFLLAGILVAFFGVACFVRVGRAQDEVGLASSVEVHHDLEYASVNGFSLKLDLYVPKTAAKPMPLFIWIHGGSWKVGDKNKPWMLKQLTDAGFAEASIEYRFSQQAIFPAQLFDCKAAVRYLRAHAAEYNIDPNRIGVGGASAGGHLVALLGTTANHPELEGDEGNNNVSSTVQAVCDFFGPADFMHWSPGEPSHPPAGADSPIAQLIGGRPADIPEKANAASPMYYVSAKSAPFFIVHGDHDTLVPLQQSTKLNDALKKAGVPSDLYVVPGAGHGTHDPIGIQKSVDFLKRTLQPQKST